MSGFRVSEEADSELAAIGLYVAVESGSLETAERLLDRLKQRFKFLGQHLYAGRSRDDLRRGLRGFPAEGYTIIYRVEDDHAVILHVVHQSRDLSALFQH